MIPRNGVNAFDAEPSLSPIFGTVVNARVPSMSPPMMSEIPSRLKNHTQKGSPGFYALLFRHH